MGLLLAAYAALGTACETQDLQALAVGLEAAANQLQGQTQSSGDDITFGEWLISELND